MTGDVARRFHEATAHRPGRPAGGGPFDPRIEPAKVKRYPGLDADPLPADWPEPNVPSVQSLSGRGPDGSRSLDVRAVSRLLFLSHGVTRTLRGRGFRAAPSAGALYPVELYVVCGDLPGMGAGVYHHDPEARTLTRVRAGDHRSSLATACADLGVARRPLSIVCTGIPWRTTWKYGPRGYRHLFWDAGVILANTWAAATAGGHPVRVVTAFVDDRVARVLDLGEHEPFDEWPLAVAAVGERGPEAPSQEGGEPPRHEVAELSSRHVAWPEIAQVHRAGDLGDAGAVEAWRGQLEDTGSEPAPDRGDPPGDATATMDEVILRRGSTRRFDATERVARPVLTWGLPVAQAPIPGDLAPEGRTTVGADVAVHAVEGVEPGGYRWAPDGPERVVADQPRETSAHLCLDQRLGGTSAFTAFLGVRLDPALRALGARGYRVANLAAGIVAGRLQLAAFARGCGGTGLTFYDGEVRRHFGGDRDPLLVAAIGVPDYEIRPGSRPSAA